MKKLFAALSILSVLFFFTPVPALAAGIAFDNALLINAASGSYTVTGTDPVLFAEEFSSDTSTGPAMSFNGVAMTLITSQEFDAQGQKVWAFYLLNPPTGAHTLAGSFASGSAFFIIASSYTGASQTVQPDAFTSSTDGSPVSSASISITPTVANTWASMFLITDKTPTASTGSTARTLNTGSFSALDSNGTITSGTPYSMSVNLSPAGNYSFVVFTITPFSTPASIPISAYFNVFWW